MRFLQALKEGKIIESCIGKQYDVTQLNVKWIGETAVNTDSHISHQEIKSKWRVIE